MENAKKNHIRQLSYVRVLGLALVLGFHFFPQIFPGGFFGVDVFFVFSGYLITALALQEFRQNGDFDLGKFAQRRFFRIFPTVAFAMLVIVPLTLAAPAAIKYQLKEQVFAGLSFISNFYEASTGQSYANNFAPHIWVHLWSLALEVQFYIVWGLIIWVLMKVGKQISKIQGFTLLAGFFLLIVSALSMIVGSFGETAYSNLYYSLFNHIFPFFFGAMLATLAGISPSKFLKRQAKIHRRRQVWRNVIISAGLLLLLSFIFQFNWKATYVIGFLLASGAALALIFWLRVLHMKTDKAEPRVIIFFADISYGIYIFHWPFLTLFRAMKLGNLLSVLLTLTLSIGLSALMFYGIDPILQGKRKLTFSLAKWGIVAAAAALFIISVPAVASSYEQTSLDKSLWEASDNGAATTLNFAQKYLASGVNAKMTSLIVGDSVTVQESSNLAAKYPNMLIDALSSRRIDTSLQTELNNYMPYLSNDATLIIALGINSVYPDRDNAALKAAVEKYHGNHKIILITPGNADEANQTRESKSVDLYERSLAKQYKNVTVDDWEAALNGNSDWVAPDGIHPSGYPAGMSAWMSNLEQAINKSGAKV